MKSIILLFCGLLFQISCFAQIPHSITSGANGKFDTCFSTFVTSLKTKKRSDYNLVRILFNKAHRDYLKNYVAYSQVADIFKTGNYDCLTGTYFFAKVLEELNIPHKIFETNYHIFLTVQTERGEILIESTDRINGLVQNQKAIEIRITSYQQAKPISPNSELYLSRIRIFHELRSQQLPGLLYYNQAVAAFNKNDFSNSYSYLEKAWKIYDNQRIEIFAPILLHAIAESQMEIAEKEKLIQLIKSHQQTSLYSIAFR